MSRLSIGSFVKGPVRHTTHASEQGQVLVIVAAAFVVILGMLALLFDGANAMVARRHMQDAGDAAALAAANVLQIGSPRGCSATTSPSIGAPRTELVTAARSSVSSNLPGFDTSHVNVVCPNGYGNQAVQVDLDTVSTRFFSGIFTSTPPTISTHSAAINGQLTSINYSVVELDPSNASWPNGQRGCPSVLLSGGPTVILDGSMQINSACTAANGGALSTNGNAASVTMNNGSTIRIVGQYKPSALTITPAPVQGVTALKDPLAGLPPVNVAAMPVRSSTRLVLSNTSMVLQPGVYQGGIQLKNSSKAYLRPGIYVMAGGGLDMGAQAEIYSVQAGVSSTTSANWATDCPAATCGVLIFNTTGSTAMGQVSVAAGTVMKLRAYNPDADASGYAVADFHNILIWQDGAPVPTSSYAQPSISLRGGGSVDISGTVYAPSALVDMGGSSGGSGGDTVNLTLQFITWDLSFQGNSSFHFFYNDNDFARPTNYGLVE
jgi:Flp pilus assembly protein TadG